MKSFGLFICLAMVMIVSSCKKEEITREDNSIAGSWELRHASGSMRDREYPAGNGNVLNFSDATYKKYENGRLVASGNYTIVGDNTAANEVGLELPAGQFTHRIIFENYTTTAKIFIDFSDGQLSLISGFFPTDGGSKLVYVKIEP